MNPKNAMLPVACAVSAEWPCTDLVFNYTNTECTLIDQIEHDFLAESTWACDDVTFLIIDMKTNAHVCV